MGTEEIDTIEPALESLRVEGVHLVGITRGYPFPT